MNEYPVVVGVDGTPASEAAVRYGAQEAARLGAGLRLVHVAAETASLLAMYPALFRSAADAKRFARRMLRHAVEQVGDVVPLDRISAAVLTGSVADGLVTAGEEARLLVLGDQHRPLVDRMFTGSVLAGVAGHSRAPVVAVPANWEPGGHRPVVAAVKDSAGSLGLVRRALEIADRQQARLVLLHAWQLPVGYDDLIALRVDEDQWAQEASGGLRSLVDDVHGDFPDVEVDLRVVHGQPAHVLCEASRNADLLLLARRPHGFPWGHLGATGRAVLRESRCPVEVLPPAGDPVDLGGLVLEQNGVLVKEA